MSIRPILLLEFNEIPWKVIDHYSNAGRLPRFQSFFKGAKTFTTISEDSGELSPWVTWPSLHRGLHNLQHGIKNLGQDVGTYKGKTIWDEFRSAGHSIGIFGSLQSWPAQEPGPNGFYIPDTFAHDEKCIPSYVDAFQKFNLGQVKKNGRIVNARSLWSTDLLKLLSSVPRLGISSRTVTMIAAQLLQEKFDRSTIARRPIFQTILCWDLFKKLYRPEHPPAFSSFFTNHIAGLMHRYWHHLFQADFQDARFRNDGTHLKTFDFGMRLTERMIEDALHYQKINPELILVFASSMGQGPVDRSSYHEGYELTISSLEQLLANFNFKPEDYRPLLAMAPQAAFDVKSEDMRQKMKRILLSAKTISGKDLFRIDEIGTSLSITIGHFKKEDLFAGGFSVKLDQNESSRCTWEAAGITLHEVEPGTGYHIPEGSLAIYGEGIAADQSRAKIRATEVKQLLMELSGLKSIHQNSSTAA